MNSRDLEQRQGRPVREVEKPVLTRRLLLRVPARPTARQRAEANPAGGA
jgi:hypothetical protein